MDFHVKLLKSEQCEVMGNVFILLHIVYMKKSLKKEESTSLENQFYDPLSMVDYIAIDPSVDIVEFFKSINDDLIQKEDWSLRRSAIKDAMSCLKSEIYKIKGADFSIISPGISSCISELRSALVKWACLYIASAAQTLKTKLGVSVDMYVPSLFKQLTHGTSIISDSCHFALIEIAKYVQHKRTIKAFLGFSSSKAVIQRLVVLEFIGITREWCIISQASFEDNFCEMLKKFMNDPSAEIRKKAKIISSGFLSQKIQLTPNIKNTTSYNSINFSPNLKNSRRDCMTPIPFAYKTSLRIEKATQKYSSLNDHLDDSMDELEPLSNSSKQQNFQTPKRKSLTKTVKSRKRSSLQNNEILLDIEDYMPPKSYEDTKNFIQVLNRILRRRDFERLEGIEVFLVSSIVSGSQFEPDIEPWKKSLPILFETFNEIFSNQIHELLIAFDFDIWLLQTISMFFNLQKIGSDIMNISKEYSYKFYVTIFKENIPILITKTVKNHLIELIKIFKNDEDIHYLTDIIEDKSQKQDMLFSNIYQNIIEEKDYFSLLKELSDNINENSFYIDEIIFQNDINEILIYSNENQKLLILEFCYNILTKISLNIIMNIINSFINLIFSPNEDISSLSKQFIVSALNIYPSLIDSLLIKAKELIDNNDEEKSIPLLSFLLKYYQGLSGQEIQQYYDKTFEYFHLLVLSSTNSIRKCLLNIFDEFKLKSSNESKMEPIEDD